MFGYVYVTTNLINGKKYIGKKEASTFRASYKGSGKLLRRAMQKYGWENFECHILEPIDVPTMCSSREELNESEKHYIKYFDCVNSPDYYNIALGGDGGSNSCNGIAGRNAYSNASGDVIFISKGDVVPDGFYRGNCKTAHKHNMDRYYSDAGARKRNSEAKRGTKNSSYGNGHRVSGGQNGHAIYVYTFEGVDYQCRDDLMEVLKPRWQTISEYTIRKIQNGSYGIRIAKKYGYVIDNLSWRFKDEDKIRYSS